MICMGEAGMKRVLFKIIVPVLILVLWILMCYPVCQQEKCIFSLPEDEWEKCRMRYKDEDTFGFVLSNKYILGLYKYCREARRDFATDRAKQGQDVSVKGNQLMEMRDVEVLAHCLMLDNINVESNFIIVAMYTIFVMKNP